MFGARHWHIPPPPTPTPPQGNNVASPMHHLKDDNGTLITDRVEIANTLGAAIEKKFFFRKLLQRVPIYQGTKRKAQDQL